jgi:predicted membrane channel-forming protein YqfA (hemolysin III family)
MSSTTLTTVLGILQAAGIAIIDFVMTAPESPDGSRWTSPMFYVGLVVAALMAVKAYYTKGIDAVPAPPK